MTLKVHCAPWVFILLAVACSRAGSDPSPEPVSHQGPPIAETALKPAAPEASPMNDHWSLVVDGLQVQAVSPGPAPAGGKLVLTLRFRNTSPEQKRIYLVRSEPFRAMQSTFYLPSKPDGPPRIQPEPRPHGYVVTEADFHTIAGGGTVNFTQTLRLPADLSPGVYPVRWVYRNAIERWKGGVQTLDGPTQALFGGERIPGIWLGELEYRFEVVVEPA